MSNRGGALFDVVSERQGVSAANEGAPPQIGRNKTNDAPRRHPRRHHKNTPTENNRNNPATADNTISPDFEESISLSTDTTDAGLAAAVSAGSGIVGSPVSFGVIAETVLSRTRFNSFSQYSGVGAVSYRIFLI